MVGVAEAPRAAYLKSPIACDPKATSLVEVLRRGGRERPDALYLNLLDSANKPKELTFRHVLEGAERWARWLLQLEARSRGSRVALLLPTGERLPLRLLRRADGRRAPGAAGLPAGAGQPRAVRAQPREDRRERLAASSSVTVAQPRGAGQEAPGVDRRAGALVLPTQVAEAPAASFPEVRADDVALVQYASGRVHAPTGAVLTHRQVLSQRLRPGHRPRADRRRRGADLGAARPRHGPHRRALHQPVLALPAGRDAAADLPDAPLPLAEEHQPVQGHARRGAQRRLPAVRQARAGAAPQGPGPVALAAGAQRRRDRAPVDRRRPSARSSRAVGFNPKAMFPTYGLAENTLATACPRPTSCRTRPSRSRAASRSPRWAARWPARSWRSSTRPTARRRRAGRGRGRGPRAVRHERLPRQRGRHPPGHRREGLAAHRRPRVRHRGPAVPDRPQEGHGHQDGAQLLPQRRRGPAAPASPGSPAARRWPSPPRTSSRAPRTWCCWSRAIRSTRRPRSSSTPSSTPSCSAKLGIRADKVVSVATGALGSLDRGAPRRAAPAVPGGQALVKAVVLGGNRLPRPEPRGGPQGRRPRGRRHAPPLEQHHLPAPAQGPAASRCASRTRTSLVAAHARARDTAFFSAGHYPRLSIDTEKQVEQGVRGLRNALAAARRGRREALRLHRHAWRPSPAPARTARRSSATGSSPEAARGQHLLRGQAGHGARASTAPSPTAWTWSRCCPPAASAPTTTRSAPASSWSPWPTARSPPTSTGRINVVDARDVALGHLAAATQGPGGRALHPGRHEHRHHRPARARMARRFDVPPPGRCLPAAEALAFATAEEARCHGTPQPPRAVPRDGRHGRARPVRGRAQGQRRARNGAATARMHRHRAYEWYRENGYIRTSPLEINVRRRRRGECRWRRR